MSIEWVTGIVGFIVWFVLLMATMYLAGSRGRSVVLWGLIGFFVPLIALIIVAVLPSKRDEVRRID